MQTTVMRRPPGRRHTNTLRLVACDSGEPELLGDVLDLVDVPVEQVLERDRVEDRDVFVYA